MAICSGDKVHLCEVASGKFIHQLNGVPKTLLSAVAFSPDGRLLITGEWPKEGLASNIRLWEVATGEEVLKFSGHRGAVRTVRFSPDGRLAASGGADTSIVVWDVLTHGRERSRLNDATPSELWTDLASTDAARAYRAVCTLASAPSEAVELFSRHLRPTTPPENTRINSLLHQLDDDRFAVRERATKELSGLRDIAESVLRNVLDEAHTSPEVRGRLERLLNAPLSPDALRVVRAIQALEIAGTPEAKALLERLATGTPEARLTHEAKASTARLARCK
jgi:hypothetical protein